ncbi:MAG: formylmethanofuran dehydrogenase [Desulfobulbaceae bacterium]|uniref:Formylmethanofuran dehydrogenase n=1 Tax=Candidatus Desulfatifera sulfidica TaxID=2841691 RepID=A0A8J6TD54_9BACT|nr:formylmethanofuran dehydrogenase [Candidatus Desulfatifera sulfidica]
MMKTFEEVVRFHGHACPGLAFGFRVAEATLTTLGDRAQDEELVAIVENRSCAVDAIQAVCGCTLGKGNLVVRDYGKQVYTFLKRPDGAGIRISVIWNGPTEDAATTALWQQFFKGDRTPEVMRGIRAAKGRKMQAILKAELNELFEIREIQETLPEAARVWPSIRCAACGEKTMEPMIQTVAEQPLCIPCAEANKHPTR